MHDQTLESVDNENKNKKLKENDLNSIISIYFMHQTLHCAEVPIS